MNKDKKDITHKEFTYKELLFVVLSIALIFLLDCDKDFYDKDFFYGVVAFPLGLISFVLSIAFIKYLVESMGFPVMQSIKINKNKK